MYSHSFIFAFVTLARGNIPKDTAESSLRVYRPCFLPEVLGLKVLQPLIALNHFELSLFMV